MCLELPAMEVANCSTSLAHSTHKTPNHARKYTRLVLWGLSNNIRARGHAGMSLQLPQGLWGGHCLQCWYYMGTVSLLLATNFLLSYTVEISKLALPAPHCHASISLSLGGKSRVWARSSEGYTKLSWMKQSLLSQCRVSREVEAWKRGCGVVWAPKAEAKASNLTWQQLWRLCLGWDLFRASVSGW